MAAVIAILGAGPHGHEIATFLQRRSRVVLYDDFLDGYEPVSVGAGLRHLIGAAWPKVRREIAAKTNGPAWNQGIVLFPGAVVSPAATLGEHCHVGYNAVISHGCHVGRFVTVCAGAVLSGDVQVGDDVFIGVNASIIHGGITIGEGATIGAGAVVIDHVPSYTTVIGVPARAHHSSGALL